MYLFSEPVHKFTKELKDSEVEEKGSVTLQCETAQPASKATWSKGGVELMSGGRYEMSQKETILTLTIKQLEEKDGGTYTCDVGTATMTAKVTVKGKTLVYIQYRSFLYNAFNYYEITKQFMVNWYYLWLKLLYGFANSYRMLITFFNVVITDTENERFADMLTAVHSRAQSFELMLRI